MNLCQPACKTAAVLACVMVATTTGSMPARAIGGGPWTLVASPFPGSVGSNPLLLGDGKVMVHDACTGNWETLSPDKTGNYVAGTWAPLPGMPAGYGPLGFASAVLPDGRVIIEGGAANNPGGGCTSVGTNAGALYDPATNSWTAVSPPAGWSAFGPSPSAVLNDGTFMLGDDGTDEAKLNASTLGWTATGINKFDSNAQEQWVKLGDGSLLTVNDYYFYRTTVGSRCGNGSQRFLPAGTGPGGTHNYGGWYPYGDFASDSTHVQLADCNPSYPGNPSYALGPMVLRPYGAPGVSAINGSVIAFGGTTTGAAHSAIYTGNNGAALNWQPGPDIPIVSGVPYTGAFAPAALLPDGNVLFAASPSNWASRSSFPTPTHFFEYDGSQFIPVPDNADAAATNASQWNFLILPTGQILATDNSPNVWIYTPSGTPVARWVPSIHPAMYPKSVVLGGIYMLGGEQFNGLSQGSASGAVVQGATNYPIVRIVGTRTGHVVYARAFGVSTMALSVGTNATVSFQVPSGTDFGQCLLYVVANGIASPPRTITVYGPA